jgi:hypothetical protein
MRANKINYLLAELTTVKIHLLTVKTLHGFTSAVYFLMAVSYGRKFFITLSLSS